MDTIYLPRILGTATLNDAVGLLIQSNQLGSVSGIVADLESTAFVLEAGEILQALHNQRIATLADIVPKTPSIVLPPRSPLVRSDIERMFDNVGASYGIYTIAGDVAQVLTRHEGLAALLRIHLSICRCRDPRRHVVTPADLDFKKKCPECGADVDCS